MVYMILGSGFEEIEAVAACDILRRGGAEVKLAGIGGTLIGGANGIAVQADCTLEDVRLDDMEMLIVPGGGGGVESIKASAQAMDLLSRAHAAGKELAAICAGPTVLAKLHITDGLRVTCYPGTEGLMGSAIVENTENTMRDGKITTGRGPGAGIDFGLKVLEVLKGKAAAEKIAGDMFYRR